MPTTKKKTPTRTARKAPTKKNQKKTFMSKLKSLRISPKNPIVAILIVGSVAAIGYFGYVRSNANTLGSTPPTVKCGQKMTKKECNQKQAESDAKFYAQLAQQCEGANRKFTGTSCGGCLQGYENQNGNCKKRQKVDCSALNRKQQGDYDCGGCLAGYEANGERCKKKDKVNCAAQNRKQKNDDDCGGCVNGYEERNGNCKPEDKKPNCAAQNRTQKNNGECGGCVNGYEDKSGTCKPTITNGTESPSQIRARCAAQSRVYEAKNNACGGCLPGYDQTNGKCVKKETPADVKAVCAAAFLNYDKATNSCAKTCVNGYTKEGGKCVPQKSPALVRAECAQQHKMYDPANNRCSNTCWSAYVMVNGACVEKKDKDGVKAACEAVGLEYNQKDNKCKNTCIAGFVKQDGKCIKPNPVDPTIMQQQCARKHLVYNLRTNTCKERQCVPGFVMKDGSCKRDPNDDCRAGDADKCVSQEAKREACAKRNLQYDSKTNKCSDKCMIGFEKQDGKCVDKASVRDDMTERLCKVLGRKWLPNEDGVTGTCSQDCRNKADTYQGGKTDVTSFCKSAGGETGGVRLEITKENCEAANQIWLSSIGACSARCERNFSMKDGKCEPNQIITGDVVRVCDPAIEECSPKCEAKPNQWNCTVSVIRDEIVCNPEKEKCSKRCEKTNDVDNCTIPSNPATDEVAEPQSPDGTKVELDTTISQEVCSLMGREWVTVTAEDGTEAGGCSMSTCLKTGDTIATNDNGVNYCKSEEADAGYVVQIPQEDCEALNRVWIDEAQGCAHIPVPEGTTDKFVNATQCVAPYTTYFVRENGQGECLEPSLVDQVQAVAETFGELFTTVLDAGPAAFCALREDYYWNAESGECLYDRAGQADEDRPAQIQATPMSGTQILLDLNGVPSDGYKVFYGSVENLISASCWTDNGRIGYGSCFVNDVQPNTGYTFYVYVEDELWGVSDQVVTPVACVPFDVEVLSDTKVRVSWGEVEGANYYTVSLNNGHPTDQQLAPNSSIEIDRQWGNGNDEVRVDGYNGFGFDFRCPAKSV